MQGSYEGDWATPSGELAHDKGKFLNTLQKQADGSWKFVHSIWNSDAPPAALPVPTGAIDAKAGPELKGLGWFTGVWQFDVDVKETPLGPKGKQTTTTDCRWFASGQHVICTNEGTIPAGPYHEVFVMSYDTETKTYKGYDVDTAGITNPYTLTFKDNVWTFDYANMKIAGKPFKLRVTLFDVAKDAFSVKQEFSTGGAWTVVAEGKGRRIGG